MYVPTLATFPVSLSHVVVKYFVTSGNLSVNHSHALDTDTDTILLMDMSVHSLILSAVSSNPNSLSNHSLARPRPLTTMLGKYISMSNAANSGFFSLKSNNFAKYFSTLVITSFTMVIINPSFSPAVSSESTHLIKPVNHPFISSQTCLTVVVSENVSGIPDHLNTPITHSVALV